MKVTVNKLALFGLQGSLALVILMEAAFLAFAPAQIRTFGKTGIHDWVRVGLAWSEMLFAILFIVPLMVPRAMVPRAMIVGGWGLLVVFLFAAGVHVLHGWMDVGYLVIYSAAVLVIMSREADRC
jgi:hypothetical protein